MDAPHLTGSALDAAISFARANGLPPEMPIVLNDGSNLLVRLAPAPVVLRIATFTAAIRGDPLPYLQREVALVSWLASAGASVMAPSELVAAGPHLVHGWAMTAWRYVEHHRGIVPQPADALAALDELLAAMRAYPGALPVLNPAADDLDRAIAYGVAKGALSADEAADLTRRRDRLLAAVLDAASDEQALHGDAFPRNSLVTPTGIVWIDFEDACSGPAIWDLAVMVRSTADPAVRARVQERVGADRLRDAVALRDLQASVWHRLHDARRGS